MRLLIEDDSPMCDLFSLSGRLRSWGLIGLFWLLPLSVTVAELPSIRFDRLKPLGTSAGQSVEVEIAGSDIEGLQGVLFDHPGIQATPIEGQEKKFTVKVADNVPPGTYEAYLSGRFGISNPRLFAVSAGLQERDCDGKNQQPVEALAVEINSAVNATMSGNADHYFRFTARQKQRITIDCQAQRLFSDLDGTMNLLTSAGRVLASSGDYYAKDPFIDFIAPAEGEYLISLSDLSYRGGAPYRLVISDRPQLEGLFPPVAQIGQPVTFTAIGRNLQPLGGKTSTLEIDRLPLDQLALTVTLPGEAWTRGDYLFHTHPNHHSVVPTAATCTLTGLQFRPDGIEAVFSEQALLLTDLPVQLEAEPNDTTEQAQLITIPAIVAGRFEETQDADWYRFEVPENGPYVFNVYCERIAGRADPYLVIMDDKGRRITELDDFGHRVNAFDGHLRDPNQEVNLSAKTEYRIMVQDVYRRGGPRYQYVLDIRRQSSEFFPSVINRNTQQPAGVTVFKGTANHLDVVVHHHGNSRTPFTITGENLPAGLHVAPTTITNNNRGTVVLWADAEAPEWTGPINLIATAQVDGQTLVRTVRPYTRVSGNTGSAAMRQLMVAIREQGPFHMQIEPAQLEVEQGQTAELELQLQRLWPEFQGKVTVQPLNFPGNFKLGNFDITPDKSAAPLKISVQDNTTPGQYTLTVLGQGQVPFDKNSAAEKKGQTLVSLPALPVTLIVREKPKP